MITIAQVAALTARTFEVELSALLSGRNGKQLKDVKWTAVWLTRRKLGASQTEVAAIIGDMDHSSVAYIEKHFPDKMNHNPMLKAVVTSLGDQIDILNEISERENIEPLTVARRIIDNPKRVALQVSLHETYVMARVLLEVWEVAEAGLAMAQIWQGGDGAEAPALDAISKAIIEEMTALTGGEQEGETT